jgi:DNA-binding NtrC family response regulator
VQPSPRINSDYDSSNQKRNLLYLKPKSVPDSLAVKITSEDWHVYTASDVKAARELNEAYNCPVGLTHLEAMDKQELHKWEELCSTHVHSQWIALVSRTFLQDKYLCELVRTYCFDFHTLPVNDLRLLVTLGRAYGIASLQREAYEFRNGKLNNFGLIGKSAVIQKLLRDIEKLGRNEAPVLISGESGTGKELTAYAIHTKSCRVAAPFVAVNCAAIPANLIQSELFGYEKGAFTGADQRKIGRIEAALGGTLFLDEVGDFPFELQGNLLRFLQEKTIARIGGVQSIPVDVRVIAATPVDLERAITEGRFRQDLYYRLNVLQVRLPSLRERVEDIELLAKFFFEQFIAEKSPHVKGFSRRALEAMCQYSWPGNVRELINRVRQAMIMAEHRLITPVDLGLEELRGPGTVMTLKQARAVAEEEAIKTALQYTRQNLTQASSQLGISRMTLHRLLEKYGMPSSKPE